MPLELRKVVQSEEDEDLDSLLLALSMRSIRLSLQVPAAVSVSSMSLPKATPLSSVPEMILRVPK